MFRLFSILIQFKTDPNSLPIIWGIVLTAEDLIGRVIAARQLRFIAVLIRVGFTVIIAAIPKVKGKACCFHRSACLKAFVQPLTFYTVLFEVEYFIGMFTKYLIERKKIRKRKMVAVKVFHSLTNAVKCLLVFLIVKLDIHC